MSLATTPVLRRPIRLLALVMIGLAVALAVAMATQAATAQALTRYSCTSNLTLRAQPLAGAQIYGYVLHGWTINVTQTSGAWSGGTAGYVDPVTGGAGAPRFGWVLTQYTSTSPC